MFKFIDNFLLVEVQRLCDKFTMLTGSTKFRLEILAIMVETPFCWAFAVKYVDVFIFALVIIITIANVLSIHRIKIAEQEFLKNDVQSLCNDWNEYANYGWFRCLTLIIPVIFYLKGIMIGFSLMDIFLMLWSFAFAVEMYISACAPLHVPVPANNS